MHGSIRACVTTAPVAMAEPEIPMDKSIPLPTTDAPARPSRLTRLRESDLWFSFCAHPSAIFAAVLLALVALTAFLAPWITPQNPYDLAALELWNSEIPPIWEEGG